jgi:glycosyltransferase involved in cell wall biosynthesis
MYDGCGVRRADGMDRLHIGVLTSHPIQYQAPLFRALAGVADLEVFFAHKQSAAGQAEAEFGVEFDWDINLLDGYPSRFLENVSQHPSVGSFSGCDTPEIGGVVRHGRYDGFVVTGWYLKTYWQAVAACKKAGVPVLVRGDSQLPGMGPRWRRMLKRVVYPHLLSRFDGFLFVGQRNREYLRYYGVPDRKLFFSPHCVDNERFREQSRLAHNCRDELRAGFGATHDTLVCLFVGKFVARKRPIDLVTALGKLVRDGLDVVGLFVGAGPLEDELRTLAAECGARVGIVGFVNQSALAAYYDAADMLVLPSNGTETWGLVVNEAMACGLPVVVSDAVGCGPDLVEEGITGRRFAMGDIDALANVLADMNGEAREMRASGRIGGRIDRYSPMAAARGVVEGVGRLSKTNQTQ